MDERTPARLVVCAGATMPAEYAQVIATFTEEEHCRFVRSDWLDPDTLRNASILWIMDDSEPWDALRVAFRAGMPLLLRDTNLPVKHLCLNANCGLVYRDAEEARACLLYLLHNEAMRSQIGANGLAYFP